MSRLRFRVDVRVNLVYNSIDGDGIRCYGSERSIGDGIWTKREGEATRSGEKRKGATAKRAEANFYSSRKLNRRVQDGPIKSQSRRAVRLPVERLVIIAIAIRLLNEFGKRIRRDQLFAAAHVKYAS